jgi:uncharacterized membrane protein HdeD (DUF308 family)
VDNADGESVGLRAELGLRHTVETQMPTDVIAPAYAPTTNRQVLGICWIIYGIARILFGIWLALFSATATVMFGALLTRVPNYEPLMAEFHLLYWCAIGLFVLGGVFGILAGLALLASQTAGRLLSIIASFLCVSELPFGVVISVYTLIVMIPARGTSHA